MPPPLIMDPSTIDCSRVVADREAIRKVNPHRGAMELLSAVVSMDTESHVIVGYFDISKDAFWVPGHFPGRPLFPGVLQCESAAQLLSYFATVNNVAPGMLLGLGGIDNARFRGTVEPGQRLVIVGKGLRVHRRQTIFHCQGFINNENVFEADVMGIPIGPVPAA